jgi:hypothetical protein
MQCSILPINLLFHMQTILISIFAGAIVSGIIVYFLITFFTKKAE